MLLILPTLFSSGMEMLWKPLQRTWSHDRQSLHPPETTSSQEPQHFVKGKPRPAQLVIITSDSPVISLGVQKQTKTKRTTELHPNRWCPAAGTGDTKKCISGFMNRNVTFLWTRSTELTYRSRILLVLKRLKDKMWMEKWPNWKMEWQLLRWLLSTIIQHTNLTERAAFRPSINLCDVSVVISTHWRWLTGNASVKGTVT